jgi:hypothetical protein
MPDSPFVPRPGDASKPSVLVLNVGIGQPEYIDLQDYQRAVDSRAYRPLEGGGS